MEENNLQEFKNWFKDYVSDFYENDEYADENYKLKEEHSLRVCDEMNYLTAELQLDESKKPLAELVALLHDIGRFKQFKVYRTYNDVISTNHCMLGLEILDEINILKDLPQAEKKIIETAIKCHGIKKMPKYLAGDELLFTKLIRDADKLDIYYLVIEYYKQYRENPDGFRLEIDLPDTDEYSDELIQGILTEKRIGYGNLRTFNDMKLLQLGWVYDINFIPTYRRIKKRNFLETIIDFLPETEDILRAKNKVLDYVDDKIEQADKIE